MPWRGPRKEGEFPSLGYQLIDRWHEVLPSPRDESKPFLLTDRQALDVIEWYAIHPLTGEFIYRRGCSQDAKGTGKSPLEAAKCISELGMDVKFGGWDADGEPVAVPWGYDGLPSPWVQIASLSEDQDENTWTPLYYFLTANDGRAADLLRLDPGLTRVFHRDKPGAKIEPVTSRAGSREGQPVTYGNLDETGLMTATNGGVKLARTIRKNVSKMGGRAYETTNGYPPGEGTVAEGTHKASKTQGGILYLQREAPRTVDGIEVDLHAPDHILERALDVPYEGCWWVDTKRLVADIRDPDAPWADSMRFFFNWNVAPESAFVDITAWETFAAPDRLVEPGEPIGLGFDGSINRDCTVLYGVTADRFVFEIAVWERPAGVEVWKVPRLEVDRVVAETFEQYRVGRMLCDPAKWWSEIETWAERYGDDVNGDPLVVAFDTNSARRFAPVCGRFVTAVNEGVLSHDGKPTLTAHLAACARKKVRLADDDEDGRTMFVIVKADTRKIDAAVGAVLANEAAATMAAPVDTPTWFGAFD